MSATGKTIYNNYLYDPKHSINISLVVIKFSKILTRCMKFVKYSVNEKLKNAPTENA